VKTKALCSVLFLALFAAACGKGNDDSGQGNGATGGTGHAGGLSSIDINGAKAGGNSGGATNVCDSIQLVANSIPPRVVFVQDLSSSMSSRWQPLDDAMVSIANQFGDRMQLGLIPFSSVYLDHVAEIRADNAEAFTAFFNAHDNDCVISASSIVPPAPNNAAKVIAVYDAVDSARMVGGTPTYAAMEQARSVLVDQAPGDGSQGYAILVTDGEPNCTSPTSNLIGDVQVSIGNLAALGVNTYVVGYNYSGAALDQWARAGNTTSYYNASDATKLNAAMSQILIGLLPCEFSLSAPVEDPRFVRVTVDSRDRPLNNPTDGWVLGSDKQTITLVGSACGDLRTVGNHSINVVVECSEVVVIL
jgi:hypothetical protein